MLRQDRPYNCGELALWHVLQRFGVHVSLEALEKLCGAKFRTGTEPGAIRRVLNGFALRYREERQASVATLCRHLPALVLFQLDGEGHYGVAETFQRGRLWLYDPWAGRMISRSPSRFRSQWWADDDRRWFLHVYPNQASHA